MACVTTKLMHLIFVLSSVLEIVETGIFQNRSAVLETFVRVKLSFTPLTSTISSFTEVLGPFNPKTRLVRVVMSCVSTCVVLALSNEIVSPDKLLVVGTL